MIDATVVEAPCQPANTREKNAKLGGEKPGPLGCPRTGGQAAAEGCRCPLDQENYITVDAGIQLIQDYEVTPAQVHDSEVFDDLLDTETVGLAEKIRTVHAESAYRSAVREADLARQEGNAKSLKKGYPRNATDLRGTIGLPPQEIHSSGTGRALVLDT